MHCWVWALQQQKPPQWKKNKEESKPQYTWTKREKEIQLSVTDCQNGEKLELYGTLKTHTEHKDTKRP